MHMQLYVPIYSHFSMDTYFWSLGLVLGIFDEKKESTKFFRKAHNIEMSPQWYGMALAMFKLLAYFLMFSISNGPIATNRLKFLEFFSIFKSPLALKGQRLHFPTFVKLKELHPPKK